MPKPEFRALEEALLAANVAPRYVYRTIQELSEHFEDIESDALACGLSHEESRAVAKSAIGCDAAIVAAAQSRPELQTWPSRWPRSAETLTVITYYLILPIAPLVYCIQHGNTIARWSASASLAALVTGGLLFSMQLAIA
jgi:hypothetical protein